MLNIFCVDAPCDDIMDNIAIESHVSRVGDLDTQAQARWNSGIRHTRLDIGTTSITELNRSLIGLRRAILEGDIVYDDTAF